MALTFATHDIVSDSPTNNFCTLNPLDKIGSTVSEGNLEVVGTTNHYAVRSTLGVRSGKWYFETYLKDAGSAGIGVMSSSADISDQLNAVESAWYRVSGRKFPNDSPYGSSTGDGGVIGCLFNVDTGTIEFFKNNVSMGTLGSGYDVLNTWNDNVHAAVKTFDSSENMVVNFGQDPTFAGNKTSGSADAPDANGIGAFYYQPPTGALALCTANLPDFTPTVTDDTPQDYFKSVIWSGTTYANATVPVGFTPDFVWAKAENVNSNHRLVDSVRGGNGSLMYELASNDTRGNGTDSAITGLSNNGINLSSGNFGAVSGQDIVAWCWKAGGSPSATDDGTGVSGSAKLVNTSGVASSTTCKSFKDAAVTAGASNVKCPSKMSINQAAGFSIVKYVGDGSTGSTVPHGLLEAPQIVIVKPFNGAVAFGWRVYTEMTGNTQHLLLNTSDYASTYTDWNNTSPTSNVFTSSDAQTTNHDGTDYIAYCWHSVEGYSKFGSYTGNGSADGPFVYTGFRVGWLMVKRTDADGAWVIQDNARSPYNVVDAHLLANVSNAESSGLLIDYLSNGFKIRVDNTYTDYNATNGSFIFMAFAEQPFKFSNAR
jgi:hypothetical protein